MLQNIKVIFFHIEKSMGSSLRDMLYSYFKKILLESEIYLPKKYENTNLINIDNYNYVNNLENNFKILLCHISYNFYITNCLCNNVFLISCVRNPYSRIISHYYFFDYSKYQKIFMN
jgi:hypothetical protein